ncbi:MAG: hypothetical protein CL931_00005 [Deltaproteobacteria bacterium]|nr:hypothetical protein [Deltaproteobacteria bacterium]|tara:strand:+ start:893 stop:1189 length:297 start_codon:yes stop_codon:yes gene_type:complete
MKKNIQIREVDTILTEMENVDLRLKKMIEQIKDIMLQQATIIKELKDENESLWFMLEEVKESDMKNWAEKNNNKEILQHRLDDWFAQLAVMKNNQGDA